MTRPRSECAPKPGSDKGAKNSSKPITPILVSEAEAAKMLGISPRKLFDLRKSGRVPFVHMGRRVLYRVAALEDFAASASTFQNGEVA